MTPGPFARILVGYLTTEQGADACCLAVDLATACNADLVLASIVSAVWIENMGAQTGPAVVHGRERERSAVALKEVAAELAGAPGLAHVARRLEASSSAARGLHDTAVAEQADLIVVGSSHRGPIGRALVGSVGDRLLNGAPCAVAVAPRGHAAGRSRQIRVVAIAFDGSPEAYLALSAAHRLTELTGATLRALMVLEPPAARSGHVVASAGLERLVAIERSEALQRQEQAARSTFDSAVLALGDGVPIEGKVQVGGDPAAAILDAARTDVDLLVLGSRAYGPVRRALLGSVSAAVVRQAPSPVLVTPRVGESAA
jgi:nucleotide-binding universal stress UspA family protein